MLNEHTMGIRCFVVEPIWNKKVVAMSNKKWGNHLIIGWKSLLTEEEKKYPHDFGVGAMWFATWLPKNVTWDNETEPHLYVETPGGTWDIDSRASNCPIKDDKQHRCWVRRGTPPEITVDKHGVTCNAGVGDVQIGKWHGWLEAGELI
jgi:hypothetical protein